MEQGRLPCNIRSTNSPTPRLFSCPIFGLQHKVFRIRGDDEGGGLVAGGNRGGPLSCGCCSRVSGFYRASMAAPGRQRPASCATHAAVTHSRSLSFHSPIYTGVDATAQILCCRDALDGAGKEDTPTAPTTHPQCCRVSITIRKARTHVRRGCTECDRKLPRQPALTGTGYTGVMLDRRLVIAAPTSGGCFDARAPARCGTTVCVWYLCACVRARACVDAGTHIHTHIPSHPHGTRRTECRTD